MIKPAAADDCGRKLRYTTGFFDLERASVNSRQSNFNVAQSATQKNISAQLIAGLDYQSRQNKTGELMKHTAAIAKK